MSISFLGKLGNYFNIGISFMGTSLHLHELCNLWSFSGNVNMEQIPPGDLFCVPKNAVLASPRNVTAGRPPAGLRLQCCFGLNWLVWKTRNLLHTQLLTLLGPSTFVCCGILKETTGPAFLLLN